MMELYVTKQNATLVFSSNYLQLDAVGKRSLARIPLGFIIYKLDCSINELLTS